MCALIEERETKINYTQCLVFIKKKKKHVYVVRVFSLICDCLLDRIWYEAKVIY